MRYVARTESVPIEHVSVKAADGCAMQHTSVPDKGCFERDGSVQKQEASLCG
jgi:hypothetical protein